MDVTGPRLEDFTKSGRPVTLLSENQEKIKNVLDELKYATMISTSELVALANVPKTFLTHKEDFSPLEAYRYKESAILIWWGSKDTIKNYLIALENHERGLHGDDNR